MHVLVSGAGIAGPTLAWFLAKRGACVTVLEKAKALFPHGQSVDLQGSAVTVVKRMGLLDEVRKHNTKETGTQFIDSKGTPFAPFPILEGSGASLSSEFEILRGDLAAILYRATKDLPNVEYKFDSTIRTVVKNDKSSVEVELSDGSTHEYDILVAADGQWSKVRKQCFPSEAVRAIHKGMYAVYFTVPRISSDNNMWNIYVALRSRIVALRPDSHGTTRAMFTIMPNGPIQEKEWREAGRHDRKTQQELVRNEFADAGWHSQRLLDAMNQAPDFYFHVIEQIRMSNWSHSRVICLGDAAYAPTPLTGMGTSLAIVGAYMLAGELGKLGEDEHPSKAFDTYEDKFRPYVEKSQEISSFVPAVAHPGTVWKRWLLQCFVSGISRMVNLPWVRSRLGDSTNDEDFPLPHYFDIEGIEVE
ncbi:hypothetical protein HBI65_032030 [Parastagonospora nodorum]|nr:hypothetical protein HBI65_032030 [Parastagonospora nodorum]